MSTTVPPRDGDAAATSSGTALADEQALRLAFVSEFATLDATARTKLGPDAANLSHKVVEGAFVRAWDARARFQTPEQVHQFLVDDVQHGAARALSRRAAAHRLGTPGHDAHADSHAHAATPEGDIEQSWSHVMHALHGEAHSPKALADAAAHSRHEAAGHITGVSKERSMWRTMGAAALFLAIAIGVVALIDHLGAPAKAAAAVNAGDARIITSLPAQLGSVTLDDGSKVQLAPESKLAVAKTFGPSMRAVKLDGAASFDVAPGQPSPFMVHARDAVVTAKGTSFTVRAYPGDSAATVVVKEGAVSVRQGTTTRDLAAGGALIVPDGKAARTPTAAEREEADGWRGGMLSATNRPLRDVLPELKRWYGLTVLVPNTELLTRKVTLRASLDSSRQAIRGIEESTGLEFGYQGQNMVFHERAPQAAKAKASKTKTKARR
jgi:ferric-dicitrate binding protein FerR (iron transport regulator)